MLNSIAINYGYYLGNVLFNNGPYMLNENSIDNAEEIINEMLKNGMLGYDNYMYYDDDYTNHVYSQKKLEEIELIKSQIRNKQYELAKNILLEKKEIFKETPYKYSVRVAYQTPVSIAYEGNDEEAIASTFEDCLVYTNYQLFKTIATDDTGSLIKSVSDGINIADSFETFHKGVYDTLRNGKSDQKAESALDLIYAVDPNELIVPAYIDEGLKWLQAYLDPEE